MATRENVFSDLKTKFYQWLSFMGVDPSGAGKHYRDNLEAIGEPMQPHDSPTGKWFGMYEALTGERPKPIYSVNGVSDFARNYGKAVSFFTVSKSFEAARERIRPLYPQAKDFDALFTFAYTNGDNGHTRNGFARYLEFLYELESKVTDVTNISVGVVDGSLQRVSYGAPGTGKSHGVDEFAAKLPKENVIRTTFHPDSDYSTFVGAYKPKMESLPRVAMDGTTVKKTTYDAGISAAEKGLLEVEKKITYEFVPQAFAKAYVQAWKRMATPGADGKIAPVMLVIEEINRGDCAKIFGDLFQLLDRRVKDDAADPLKKAGFSEYPVLADSDLADFIRLELTDTEKTAIRNSGYDFVVADKNLQLMLPPNMYIWATMNTSDQSLFPMDSAFKRRWDWKYTPIKDEGKNWKIKLAIPADGETPAAVREYDWWQFLEKVNGIVEDVTSSEDKKLGYFFVKTTDGIVDADMLVNKVFFFLWNDVFKDVAGEVCLQYDEGGKQKDIKFHKFFKPDGKLDVVFVNKFLSENLKVPALAAVPGTTAGGEDTPAAEGAAVEAEPAGEGV